LIEENSGLKKRRKILFSWAGGSETSTVQIKKIFAAFIHKKQRFLRSPAVRLA
jgi:hypothetical protein